MQRVLAQARVVNVRAIANVPAKLSVKDRVSREDLPGLLHGLTIEIDPTEHATVHHSLEVGHTAVLQLLEEPSHLIGVPTLREGRPFPIKEHRAALSI